MMDNLTDKVASILQELDQDAARHRLLTQRYKKVCTVLKDSQVVCNSISVACCSSTAVSLGSGVLAGAAVPLAVCSASSALLGLVFNLLVRDLNKRIKRHGDRHSMAKILNLDFYNKYMSDGKITKEEFVEILQSLEDYYKKRDSGNGTV